MTKVRMLYRLPAVVTVDLETGTVGERPRRGRDPRHRVDGRLHGGARRPDSAWGDRRRARSGLVDRRRAALAVDGDLGGRLTPRRL